MKYFSTFLLMMYALGCGGCQDSTGDLALNDSSSSNEEVHNPITWDECGHQIGEHPCNFTLNDQNGDSFSLYDHYGKVIVIDFSTMWCYYCRVAAAAAQNMQNQYGDQGLLYITILVEDAYGGEVDEREAAEWADEHGITTSPVLVGDRSFVDSTATTGYPITGWPTVVIIDKEMVLSNGINGWSEQIVTGWIENELQ